MATLDDIRDIVAPLPGVTEKTSGHDGGVGWRTKAGLFVWERPPRKTDLAAPADSGRTWPEGTIVGLRTDGLEHKEMLLASLPRILFTIPHFEGYPAVLCRLDEVDPAQLSELVIDSWILRTPPPVAREWLAANGLAPEK